MHLLDSDTGVWFGGGDQNLQSKALLGSRAEEAIHARFLRGGTVQVDSGFAFITDAINDQHFLRRKRQNRLLSLVLADAPHLGAGIGEGTAIIVEPSGMWRILGTALTIHTNPMDTGTVNQSCADRVTGLAPHGCGKRTSPHRMIG